ncbi:sugar ABC transporter permease [Microbacterium awajiense]|uniref:Sugar ABC transporter permease n=1 Tax=Microbacterium awajiense TaxID=415214 RepID=A0ABP7AS91_9MICO
MLFGSLGLWPIIRTFYLSLTNTVGTRGDGDFIGFGNFVRLMGDPYFHEAFAHTILWIVFNLTVPVGLALFLALMLNRAIQSKVIKTLFFIPLALSAPAIAAIWTFIYQPDTGLIDITLAGVGLEGLQQEWLGSEWVLLSLMIAGGWRETAFFMVIFLAGLTGIPHELVEAAKIDGANTFQVFRHVTLPSLRPATMIVMSSAFIGALLTTDLVLAMTRGGPFGSSDVLGYRMYVETFFNGNFGYGAAMAVVITLIAALFVVPYLLRMNRMQEEEN